MNSDKNPTKFPVEIFPDSIQQIIKETHDSLGYPIDYIASSILFAASVAIGNTHKVMVKVGFVESAALYMAIVGRPGANKTHPLLFALDPIFKQDKKAYKAFQTEMKEYKKLLRDFAKSSKNKEPVDEPVEPRLKKFIVSDTTPEALAATLSNNQRGVGVYVDELAGWFKNFNRYNGGSEAEFWLSSWSGSPINIDRKTSDPIYIPNPFIAVVGTIQNGILIELAKGDRNQNGFIDRILFVMPENVKKEYWRDSDLNPNIYSKWEEIITVIISETIQFDEDLNVKPNILRLTTEAKNIFYEWQQKNTDECNNEDNASIAGAFTKMDMYVARFALIIQMLNHVCTSVSKTLIEPSSVTGAIALAEYFKISASKVQSILTDPFESLSTKERNVYEALPEKFKTGDGVKLAETFVMPERNFKRFIAKKHLFEKENRGIYSKKL